MSGDFIILGKTIGMFKLSLLNGSRLDSKLSILNVYYMRYMLVILLFVHVYPKAY